MAQPGIYGTSHSAAVWKAELWKVLANDRLTTVRITNSTLVFGLDSVTFPVSPKSLTTASSTKSTKLAIWLRTVSFSRADELDYVSRFLGVARCSDTDLSVRPSKVSSLSALGIGAATSSRAASNERGAMGGFPMEDAVLDGVVIWRSSCSKRYGLQTTVTSSSRLHRLDSII